MKMKLHAKANEFRSRLFFVCFAVGVVETLILSPVSFGERLMLTALSFVLVPLGFACCWVVLIVQFYNPICPKPLLKYASLFFFYGCLFAVLLGCVTAPFLRFFGLEPMDAVGMSLAVPANIGGCLGALSILRRTEMKLKESNQASVFVNPRTGRRNRQGERWVSMK